MRFIFIVALSVFLSIIFLENNIFCISLIVLLLSTIVVNKNTEKALIFYVLYFHLIILLHFVSYFLIYDLLNLFGSSDVFFCS